MAGSQNRSLRLEKGSWRLEARTTAGILLVLTLLGLLSWLCLAQASKVSTVRYHIGEKEAERERLQRENAELLAEVMERLSVSHLENMALESGYVPAEELRYLDVPGYPGGVSGGGLAVASRPGENAVVASEEPTEPGGSGVARWWGKVISQFVAWVGTQP
jgi:hypothetical protein